MAELNKEAATIVSKKFQVFENVYFDLRASA